MWAAACLSRLELGAVAEPRLADMGWMAGSPDMWTWGYISAESTQYGRCKDVQLEAAADGGIYWHLHERVSAYSVDVSLGGKDVGLGSGSGSWCVSVYWGVWSADVALGSEEWGVTDVRRWQVDEMLKWRNHVLDIIRERIAIYWFCEPNGNKASLLKWIGEKCRWAPPSLGRSAFEAKHPGVDQPKDKFDNFSPSMLPGF